MGKYKFSWPAVLVIALLPILFLYNNCAGDTSSKTQSGSIGANGGIPGSTNPGAGKAFFESTVTDMLNSKCAGCHNQPRFGGFAPLTIFNYSSMGVWVSNGPSSVDNYLINKMRGIEAHEGGDQCLSGISESPCLEIIQWRETEIPGSGGGTPGAPSVGNLTFLSITGDVSGWAQDLGDQDAVVTVSVWVDGKANQGGTKVGDFVANQFGIGGLYAGHYFRFQLPAQFADGNQHQLYIYSGAEEDSKLLPASPRLYTAYTPSTAGMNYFNANIQGSLNCGSCHVWDYNTAYGSLINAPPHQGGSPTNNNFYRFSSGQNGHPGGNVCGGGNLCNNIQTWWNTEFN